VANPKAAWRGYITLGQLALPVRLYKAVQSVGPKFVQLHDADGSPIERIVRCRADGKEISQSDVVRAVEKPDGGYMVLTTQEIERATQDTVKTIQIKQFCDPADIPPAFYDKPYYMSPTKGGEHAYALLREALSRTKRFAVAKFVLYNREHIAAIGVQNDLLMLYQLRYVAEIVPRTSIQTPAMSKPSPTEVDTLQSIIERFTSPLYLQDYRNEYDERIQLLIERKLKGLPMPRAEQPARHATPEGDIKHTLSRMLGETKQIS
jgi:DNA end-binding protein Ku